MFFFTITDCDVLLLLLLLLLWSIFLSVFTHFFLKMVSLLSLLFSTYFVTCSDHRFLSNSTPISFHLLIVGHTAYHVALCMFLHQYCAGWLNVVCCLSYYWHLHLQSVSVLNIFIAWL
jgi:hypothetical protein